MSYKMYFLIFSTSVLFATASAAAPAEHDGEWLNRYLAAWDAPATERSHEDFMLGMTVAGYVNGVWDSLATEGTLCGTINVAQMTKLVLNYTNAHPERWREPAVLLVRDAFLAHYACVTTSTKP